VSLRLLHTSDWHLGRTLHEASLLADQSWVLDRLVEAVASERPDAVVIAGDIYDRAVPPPEAVSLLDDVLTRLADLGVPVVAIAGNHDSAERLSFGARLLEARGIHLRGAVARAHEPVELPGKGLLYALPFVEPEVVRGIVGDEAIRGHAAATEAALARARADAAGRTLPTVLVAHAFVQGAAPTPDSERPIVVGTAGSVPPEAFAGFDYVALGHLHEPQEAGPRLRYSGSLLKYSFAEAAHEKGALLVEVDRGSASARRLDLGAQRDVVRLRGTLADLLSRPELERHRGDLVEATLDDPGYVLDAKRRLQERFPFVLNVLRSALAAAPGQGSFGERVAGAGNDDLKLFESFFERVTGAVAGPEHREVLAEALGQVEKTERAA
jgi:exonuclease SbcD